eukprot:jgi/Chlat1/1616/Chrsp127S01941
MREPVDKGCQAKALVLWLNIPVHSVLQKGDTQTTRPSGLKKFQEVARHKLHHYKQLVTRYYMLSVFDYVGIMVEHLKLLYGDDFTSGSVAAARDHAVGTFANNAQNLILAGKHARLEDLAKELLESAGEYEGEGGEALSGGDNSSESVCST